MKKGKWILIASFLLTTFFISCEKEESSDDNGGNNTEVMYSRYNETESHNEGKNCMSCHKQGGSGEGVFTIGGTIYKTNGTAVYPNTTIKLYTGPNGTGTLIKTIEVDGKGNFYTTEAINFGSGLFPTVTGTTGNISKMPTAISTGACYSCHAVSTSKITAN